MFKVGDWVRVINNPEIVFQIKEFHYDGIVKHNDLLIEERFLKPYNGSLCPICGKPEVEEVKQPQPGTHIVTIVYECGTKVDYPLGSDDYIISKRCDEPQDSWFPDELDYKLERLMTIDMKKPQFKVGDYIRYTNGKSKTTTRVEIVDQITNYIGITSGENVHIDDCEK